MHSHPCRLLRRLVLPAMLAATAVGCSTLLPARPALDESDFAAIRPGMTREQVLSRFGPPTWTFAVWQEHLTIWNYR